MTCFRRGGNPTLVLKCDTQYDLVLVLGPDIHEPWERLEVLGVGHLESVALMDEFSKEVEYKYGSVPEKVFSLQISSNRLIWSI